jgi:hypothetical protein
LQYPITCIFIDLNQIQGYKVKIPFREKKNLKSTLNLRQFNKTSTSVLGAQKPFSSSRKLWAKKSGEV